MAFPEGHIARLAREAETGIDSSDRHDSGEYRAQLGPVATDIQYRVGGIRRSTEVTETACRTVDHRQPPMAEVLQCARLPIAGGNNDGAAPLSRGQSAVRGTVAALSSGQPN